MNKKSFAALLAVSVLSAGVCRAGFMEDAVSAAIGNFSSIQSVRSAFAPAGAEVPVPGAAVRAVELSCGGGKLKLKAQDSTRFSATVNDAGITAALHSAAAKFYEGEQRLVNVKFTGPSSFIVSDLQKTSGGYAAGQFAPRLDLLGGGRVKLVLTYFRMNNSYSYDYNEVASFEFDNCTK